MLHPSYIFVPYERFCSMRMKSTILQMQNPMQVKPADSEVKSGMDCFKEFLRTSIIQIYYDVASGFSY